MEYLRQLDLLDPKDIKNKSITLVGAGATGSYVALNLAQLGWGDSARGQGILRVIDGDIIEQHNLCNQAYEISHIGKPKVEALKELIKRKCGFEIETYNEMVTEDTATEKVRSTYVILLTDTMESRKVIFDKFLKYSMSTDLVIETRMGLRDGRIYAFNPHSLDEREEWESTLYTDDAAETSRCGASASIISTVTFLSSIAVQRIVQHFDQNYGPGNLAKNGQSQMQMWNEVHFSLYPESYYMRLFGEDAQMISSVATASVQN